MRQLTTVLLCALLASGCVGKRRFDVAAAEAATLAERVGRLERELGESRQFADSLRGELDKAQARAKELDALATSQEADNEQLRSRLADVQSALAELSTRSAADRAQKEELEDLLGSLESSAEEARRKATDARKRIAEVEAEVERLRAEKAALEEKTSEYDDLVSSLQSEIDQGLVKITELSGKTTVNLSNAILFDSGRYDLKADGKAALTRVASVLANVKDREIVVEGHTDNVPVNSGASYADNWALSALRASAVVSLLTQAGVGAENIAALGYGEFHPVGDNATQEGRATNRRTEIVLAPRLRPLDKGE